jgi:toxin CptA
MHSAPSVIYPVGRSRYSERLLLVFWILGACSVVIACGQAGGVGWRHGVLVISAVAAGIAAACTGGFRRAASEELSFDGQHWSLTGKLAPRSARASVGLDFQSVLLISLTAPGCARHWIWVERSAKPESWRDFRRALYSRAPLAASGARTSKSGAADSHRFSS